MWKPMFMLVLAGALAGACKKKEERREGGGDQNEVVASRPPGGRDAAKAAALKTAFEADANCKLLVACCAGLSGSSWEATLKPFCDGVTQMQDFEDRARNMVDEAWQQNECKNRASSLPGMANASNPLPAACQVP